MKNLTVLAVLSSAFAIASAAHGAEYKVDPAHSSVNFSIRHLVSNVTGLFNEFEGTFSFDPKNVSASKLQAKIKTDSINTGNAKRDGHLKTEDFFDAGKCPEITFVSNKASGSGSKFKVSGDLTMHCVTKPVTFDVEYAGEMKDPQGATRAGFSATTKIKRKDFGIVWNKTLDSGSVMLGDDVTVNLNVEAVKASGGAEAAKADIKKQVEAEKK